MASILVLNGPNPNLLGSREPGHFGSDTRYSIRQRLNELLAVKISLIEAHLSSVQARAEFRRQSYFFDTADGVISGLGARGNELALQALPRRMQAPTSDPGNSADSGQGSNLRHREDPTWTSEKSKS